MRTYSQIILITFQHTVNTFQSPFNREEEENLQTPGEELLKQKARKQEQPGKKLKPRQQTESVDAIS